MGGVKQDIDEDQISNIETTISLRYHSSYLCVQGLHLWNQHNKWLPKLNWSKLPSPLSSELWRCLLSVSESSNLHKKVAIALLRLSQDQDTFQTGSTILHLLLTSNQGQRLRIAPLEVSTKIKLKFSSPSWVFDVIYVEGILIAMKQMLVLLQLFQHSVMVCSFEKLWLQINGVLCSAANRLIGEVVQSRRRPLLGPSPGWKRLLALSHLRHY